MKLHRNDSILNWLIFQKSFYFSNIKSGQLCYSCMETTLFQNMHFSAFTKRADTFSKSNQCRIKWEGVSSICVKLEPASYENNEMQEIIVEQKFTPHAPYFLFHGYTVHAHLQQPKESFCFLLIGLNFAKFATAIFKSFSCKSKLLG